MVDLVDLATVQAQRELDEQLARCGISTANDIADCVDCGEPIGAQRKAAVPYAVRCIDCQSGREG